MDKAVDWWSIIMIQTLILFIVIGLLLDKIALRMRQVPQGRLLKIIARMWGKVFRK